VLAFARRLRGEGARVSNVVFMGMGEPLANYAATLQAVQTLNAAEGFNLGARHMTISTVGPVPGILGPADEPLQVNFAISLHAPNDALRQRTMPITRKYPIAAVLDVHHPGDDHDLAAVVAADAWAREECLRLAAR